MLSLNSDYTKQFHLLLGEMGWAWTAGQHVKRSILHLGHDPYQNSSHWPSCPRPGIAFVQNTTIIHPDAVDRCYEKYDSSIAYYFQVKIFVVAWEIPSTLDLNYLPPPISLRLRCDTINTICTIL